MVSLFVKKTILITIQIPYKAKIIFNVFRVPNKIHSALL